ncbi:transcriptional regulator, XRE family [Acidovorax delafieldii 2AN]|jgi:transcriptional regulator with XRE-family HTH domain|uniref:Transcriptional regulator, XRE family n=1 Tax=Acidovorax delafieldii 2AN TaxID=573060 RepID=C5T0D7_ACIDE|nr:helix-turn-helix transcriptional regulator [Acidovorax delafieldii]EER62090.1 transcriptional regulator, XRE family [Acidovorax delafieldii 2AN]
MAISSEERDFLVTLGERIAAQRQACGITQVQLAEVLGVSQQTVQAYEVGRRRIQVAALPTVARTLSLSLEELFGEDTQARRSKRGPASKLENQLERISTLPKPRQRMVIDVIEAMLAQHSS